MYADTVSSRATKFAKVTQLTNKHVLPSNIPPKPKGQGTIAPKFLGPATFQCVFQPVSHRTMRHKLVIASENEKKCVANLGDTNISRYKNNYSQIQITQCMLQMPMDKSKLQFTTRFYYTLTCSCLSFGFFTHRVITLSG